MKIIVVIPAYNVGHVLKKTITGIPGGHAGEIVVVDDGSTDSTADVARELGATVLKHAHNQGYGAAQMTGFSYALENNADIVIVLHGDNQYAPEAIGSFIEKIRDGSFNVVTGTRMLLGDARKNGMPAWKYFFNRLLTRAENVVFGTRISDYHDGYRGYSAVFLKSVPFSALSRKFDFDTDMLIQAAIRSEKIGEVPHVTRYAADNSMMGFPAAVCYGSRIMLTMVKYMLHRCGLFRQPVFMGKAPGKRP